MKTSNFIEQTNQIGYSMYSIRICSAYIVYLYNNFADIFHIPLSTYTCNIQLKPSDDQ